MGSCLHQIENARLLRPSECDTTGRVAPNITVGNRTLSNDEFHIVIGSPATGPQTRHNNTNNLIVYLPGTTDYPALSSCLLQSVALSGKPTIGLTYAYLDRGDTDRNNECAALPSVEDTVECLATQHEDAIYGGDYGATVGNTNKPLWQEIDVRDSILGRLGILLQHLDEMYPKEGWSEYFHRDNDSSLIPNPILEQIIFIGHSQGAGHAAYLAQTKAMHGAVLLSGPQDECVGCSAHNASFWVDGPFKTTSITALAHADDRDDYEPTLGIIQSNWERFGTFSNKPVIIGIADFDVCQSPVLTSFKPALTSSCGRRGHCSTALDDSTPFLENTFGEVTKIYGVDLWRSLVDLDKCNSYDKRGYFDDAKSTMPYPSDLSSRASEKSRFCFALVMLFTVFLY